MPEEVNHRPRRRRLERLRTVMLPRSHFSREELPDAQVFWPLKRIGALAVAEAQRHHAQRRARESLLRPRAELLHEARHASGAALRDGRARPGEVEGAGEWTRFTTYDYLIDAHRSPRAILETALNPIPWSIAMLFSFSPRIRRSRISITCSAVNFAMELFSPF